ncbi:titin-like [Acipenser ruthenus]|uniref:titin-like n=1 Tax=Acipenser ruthenus TaxID=7906 RepID=UPI002742685F|nr:titin-like [Acipenser ruthenus]
MESRLRVSFFCLSVLLLHKPAETTSPPNIHLLPLPCEDIVPPDPILTCIVADFHPQNITVNWQVNGILHSVEKASPIPNGIDGKEKAFILISHLEISMEEWKRGTTYSCVVSHDSTTKNKTISLCTACSSIEPTIYLQKPTFEDIFNGKRVSADCFVVGLNDSTVSWITDGKEHKSESVEVKQNLNNTQSITSRLTVSAAEWKSYSKASCKVTHPCSTKEAFITKETGYSKPTLQILRPSEDQLGADSAELTCIITGFFPSDIYVKWQKGDKEIDATNYKNNPAAPESGGVSYSMISTLTIPKSEWTTRNTYSCKAAHGTAWFEAKTFDNIFACSSIEPTIYLQKPTFEDIFNGKRVSADCFVVGLNNSTVSWITDGREHNSQLVDSKLNGNNTQSITSRLTVSAAEWKSYSKASCKVTHPCSTKEASITKETGYSKPTLQILRPSEHQLGADCAELTCIITGFFPRDIYVKWQKGDKDIGAAHYKNNPAAPESGGASYSMISTLTIPKSEWTTRNTYSCKAAHGTAWFEAKTPDNLFACSSIEPTIYLQKPTFEDIFIGKSVSADCFVVGLNNSTVSWITDGREHKSQLVDSKLNGNNTQSITRRLTVSAAEWKSYSKASCKVTHPCSTKEAFITKETGYSKPTLQILRPSEDQLGADRAELTCIITGFFPRDIYVKWQKGDKEIDATNYKNNPVAPESGGVSYSMISTLTIPKSEWTTRNTYSCKAAHGTAWFEAKTPDNLFGYSKPALQILRPSEDQLGADSAELTCIITAFFPSDIYVKWQKGDKEIDATNYKNNPAAPESGGVSYSMISTLTIPKSEWTTRNTYSCKAAHGTAWFEAKTPDNLFACSSIEPTIYLQKPTFEDIFNGKRVSADCFVVGLNNSTVSWITDGRKHKSELVDSKLNGNNTQSITRRLTVSAAEWKSYSKASCKVTHPCSTKEASITKETGYSKPALQILRPSEDQLGADSAALTCIITGFFPRDIYVKWQKGDKEIDAAHYKNNPAAPESGGVSYSMISTLTIPKSEWTTQNTYSCKAAHGTAWFEAKTPDNLFGYSKPALQILRPSEDQLGADSAQLTCIITGFFPRDIYVKWQKGDKEIDATNYKNNPAAPESGGVSYSMISTLTIPKSEWMTRNTYSCKAAHGTAWFEAKTPDNLFACSSIEPTIYLQKPTFVDIFIGKSVSADCFVVGLNNSTVSWITDGREHKSELVDSKLNGNNTQSITRRLTVSAAEWKSYSKASCKVTHPCSTKEASITKETACSSIEPTIYLQKPTFEDIFNGKRVSADCFVVGLNDSTVSWITDGKEHKSESVEVKQNLNNTQSITSRLTVSAAEWKSYSKASCKVTHPCSTKEAFITKETGYSKPVLQILRPSEDQLGADSAELTCIITGFFPSDIYVKWQKGDKEIDATNYKNNPAAPESGGVSYSMISTLTIPKSEWTTRNTYSCKAAHGTAWFEAKTFDNIFACSSIEPTIYLQKPTFEDIFNGKRVSADCFVVGLNNSTVSWITDGREHNSQLVDSKLNGNNTQSITRRLTVSAAEWKSYSKASCKVTHPCSTKEASITKETGYSKPTLQILRPSEHQLGADCAELTCIITGFFPRDIYVKWQKGDKDIGAAHYKNNPAAPESGGVSYSMISTLTIPKSEWTTRNTYSCKAAHGTAWFEAKTPDNLFACSSIEPTIYLQKPTFEDIFIGKSVSADCFVVGLNNSTVSWITDGREHKSQLVDSKLNGNNTQSITRRLTVSAAEWKSYSKASCKVTHPCSTKEAFITKETGYSKPTLQILRPSEDQLGADRAELTCIITGFFPRDIYVKWQKGDKEIDATNYKNNPVAPESGGVSYSMISTLTIPKSEWTTRNTYSCKAAHGTAWFEAKTPDNLFGYSKPALQILRPSEDQLGADSAELTCIITGFFPSDIYVKWQKGDKEIDATNYKNNPAAPESGGVSYSMISTLTIPKSEWMTRNTYSCKAAHGTAWFEAKTPDNLFACSSIEPTIYLQKPTFEDIFNGKRVSADCFVVGLNNSTVSWITDGRKHKSELVDSKLNGNNTQSITRRLTVSAAEWKSYSKASCKVTHPCSTKEASITKETGYSKPALQILRPSEDQLGADSAALTCIITGFFPRDIYVKWQKGDKEIDAAHYKNNPAAPESGGVSYSMISTLTIPKSEWMTQNTYSCKAAHGTAWFEAKTPDNLFGYSKPALQILRPSEDQLGADSAELTCIITGFFPRDIYVKWQKGDKEIDATNYKNNPAAPESGGVSYSMISTLTIPKSEWMTRNTYSCKAAHGTAWFEAKTSDNLFACSSIEPTIYLQKPTFVDIFIGKSVSADCFVVGLNNSTVSWITDGRKHKSELVDSKLNGNNTQSITRRLTVSAAEWKSYSKASCKVTHPCSTKEASITKETGYGKPALQILRPFKDQLGADSAELTCIITGFFPRDIYVKWQKGDKDIGDAHYKNNPAAPESGGVSYSMISTLTIPKNEWTTRNIYSCLAAHGTEWFQAKTPDNLW